MIFISVNEYAKIMSDNNLEINREQFTKDLSNALRRKKHGAKCTVCGERIWAAGSAAIGQDMCFTCITGETDSSDDYEVM